MSGLQLRHPKLIARPVDDVKREAAGRDQLRLAGSGANGTRLTVGGRTRQPNSDGADGWLLLVAQTGTRPRDFSRASAFTEVCVTQ